MARPQRKGNNYFPADVDIFSDRKIKILMARYNADGFTFYYYLLCEIYKEGYFLKVDDDFEFIVSSDLNMSVDKIGQMLNFLLERSLFNDKLFKSDKILTSHGIQSRYQDMVKNRALKNPISVDKRLWLLDESETQSYIKVTESESFSENNPLNSKNNDLNSENNPHKEKEIKEKKNKINEIKEKEYASACKFLEENFCKVLSSTEINDLYEAVDEFGVDIVKYAIEETVRNDVRAWKYTQRILDNWKTAGVKTLEQAKLQSNKVKDNKNSAKPSKFSNFENRTDIDYAELERKSLQKRIARLNE